MGIIGFKVVSDAPRESKVTKILKDKHIVETTIYGSGYNLYVNVPRKREGNVEKVYINSACYDFANFNRGIYKSAHLPKTIIYTEYVKNFNGFNVVNPVNYYALFAKLNVKGYYDAATNSFIITHVDYPFEDGSYKSLNVDYLLSNIKSGKYSTFNNRRDYVKT